MLCETEKIERLFEKQKHRISLMIHAITCKDDRQAQHQGLWGRIIDMQLQTLIFGVAEIDNKKYEL